MGIPDEQCDSIFDAFTQVSGQKYSTFGGTGLGLAITRRLIEMMSGQITVSSEVDKGTVFDITIKDVGIVSGEALSMMTAKQIDADSIRFEPANILIVDDIDYNRALITAFLNGYDFRLREAENGREAIEKIREYRPDLILMDMKMPEMDGYETVSIIKADDDLKTIPVIAVTALAMNRDQERIKRLCDSYLKQPVSKTDLISEMMKFLPHTQKKLKPLVLESILEEADEAVMTPPPKKEIEVLYSLAMSGNMNGILEQAGNIEKLGTEYHPFALKLREFAGGYQDEALLFFVEHYREKVNELDR